MAVVHQVSSAADKKKAGKSGPAGDDDEKVEAVIEDVNAKQLERLLEEKDYVAVYWCKLLLSSMFSLDSRRISFIAYSSHRDRPSLRRSRLDLHNLHISSLVLDSASTRQSLLLVS